MTLDGRKRGRAFAGVERRTPLVMRTSRRPTGADNFLRWRRSVSEHLESRRLTWPEYAMLSWLCTKAQPYTGMLRTSWPALAVQTGLSPAYAARLCRSLRGKRYVFYTDHRGRRGGLVEVAIDKFPLPGELYTDLSACFSPCSADVPADPRSEVRLDVGSDRSPEPSGISSDSELLRKREDKRRESRGRPVVSAPGQGGSLDRAVGGPPHFTSRPRPGSARPSPVARRHPPGVTRLQ
jgi:hypothetical protein